MYWPASISARKTIAAVSLSSAIFEAPMAHAGGFFVDTQSTYFQGTSFAGAAAGGDLSSMFWNSAATAELGGMNTSSNFTYIVGDVRAKVESAQSTGAAAPLFAPIYDQVDPESGDIFPDAIVSASYANYQLTDRLFVGMALNAPFGLKTEPAAHYMGSALGRKASLFTSNANPTIAYKLASGITIGAGAQIEYADGIFKFASGFPLADTTVFSADDWAFGATAGILLRPASGTTIGLGWRSQLTHTFESRLSRHATASLPVPGLPVATPEIPALSINAKADLHLPDIVTLSVRQEVTSNMRLMGSVMWTNWSRFEKLELKATETGINPITNLPVASGDVVATIEANWDDGWRIAAGGEYDYSPLVTLRAGIAYDHSPIQDPTQRLTTNPDANKVWLALGASYKYSEATTFDVAYSHGFVQEGDFQRTTLGDPAVLSTELTGNVDAKFDSLSVGMRSKW